MENTKRNKPEREKEQKSKGNKDMLECRIDDGMSLKWKGKLKKNEIVLLPVGFGVAFSVACWLVIGP